MKIEYLSKFFRQLKKLPEPLQKEIRQACRTLENWPDVENIKHLQGQKKDNRKDYRLRVGRYRVFFEVEGQTIIISEVLIRNEGTYQ